MALFGRTRPAARPDADHCARCGGTNLAVGFVDRVTVTVARRCDDCGNEWREPFVDLTNVGRVLSGHR
jgi:uncharacterized protein (DUF983 family)